MNSPLDFFQETGEIKIEVPALSRPKDEDLRKMYPYMRRHVRDTSPEIPLILTLGTVLRPGEKGINGAEYESRLQPISNILLGHQHWIWINENRNRIPKLVVLIY